MSIQGALSRRDVREASGGGALLLTPERSAAAHSLGSGAAVSSDALPCTDGIDFTALLTAEEPADNVYITGRALDLDNDPTFSLFADDEPDGSGRSSGPGVIRTYDRSGGYISAWTLDRQILRLVEGGDLAASVGPTYQWNGTTGQYVQGTMTWDCLCSADLAARAALRHDTRGTSERLFLAGEHVEFGRAWARLVSGPHAGEVWELPRLGNMTFGNVLACPHGGEKTIVALFDEGDIETEAPSSIPAAVFIYVGTKQAEGNEIERAGLTNGRLYALRVHCGQTLVTEEHTDFGLGNASTGYIGHGRFDLVQLGTAGDLSEGAALDIRQEATAADAFRIRRLEDGAWDPRGDGNDALYFVTSASTGCPRNSRLWCLRFDDVEHPERGGRIDILLANPPGQAFDTIRIDKLGRILVPDVGGSDSCVSSIRVYRIEHGALVEVADRYRELSQPCANPSRFVTENEDPSDLIDAQHIFGQGWFLVDDRTPKHGDDLEPHQDGQLLAMHIRPWTVGSRL